MIKIDHAQKNYDGFKLDCTFEVPSGSVVGLVGQNGAGKSTTFKALLDLVHLDSGRVTIMGKDVSALTPEDKEHIGVVFADSGFSNYLSVKDIIPILKSMYSSFEEEKFRKYCDDFQLPYNKQIRKFSTGMKAKLKLFIAITHKAKLLILDEPTAGLDVIVRNEMLDILREYMDGGEENTILISSHISKDLEGICDYLCFIDNGEVVLREEMDALLNNYAILKVTNEEYTSIDKENIICSKKETYGYNCLTKERQYFMENYPQLVIEKSSVDDLIVMMIGGSKA